jgi:drug/metabolite transporter (DMT)-like permease
MLTAIISVVFYQVLQKNIAINIHPAVSLMITYAVALIFSAVLFFAFPSKENIIYSIKKANYASYLLGFAVVGIEIAFLLIYRNGWKFGLATTFSSSIINVLIILTGLIVFKENISGLTLTGLIFCLIGICLISTGQ